MFSQEVAARLAVAMSTPQYEEYKARRLRQQQWTAEMFPTICGVDDNVRLLTQIIADLQICRHCVKKACVKSSGKFNAVGQIQMFKGELFPRYNDCRIHEPLTREHIVESYKQVFDTDDWLIG